MPLCRRNHLSKICRRWACGDSQGDAQCFTHQLRLLALGIQKRLQFFNALFAPVAAENSLGNDAWLSFQKDDRIEVQRFKHIRSQAHKLPAGVAQYEVTIQ